MNPPPSKNAQDDLKPEDQIKEKGVNAIKTGLLKFVYLHFYLINLILFVLSLSVLFIAQIFAIFIPVLQEIATGFMVFWMPGFCIMFLIWKPQIFEPVFYLPLTLIFSQAIIIIGGILLSVFNILWNSTSILLFLTIFSCCCFLIARKSYRFNVRICLFEDYCPNFTNFQKKYEAGEIVPRNFWFLLIFALLLGVFSILCVPVIKVYDPWYHARILNNILQSGQIPFNEFRGSLGMHIFSGAFAFLGNISTLDIARYFPIYFVFNGILACYLLFHRVLKNPQMAILGSFLVSFASLGIAGFLHGLNNFWSNAMAVPLALGILFFLFDANLSEIRSPSQKRTIIFIGLFLSFILYFLHDVIFVLFWLSALFVQIMYSKSKRSQRSNVIIVLAAMVPLLIGNFVVAEVLIFRDTAILFSLPPIIWVGVIILIYPAWKILKGMTNFPRGSYTAFLNGEARDAKLTYLIEKYLKIIIISILIAVPTITIDFIAPVGLDPLDNLILTGLSNAINFVFVILSLLGLLVIRRKEKCGSILFYWGLFFIAGTYAYALYDALFIHLNLWIRFGMFGAPTTVILVVVYIYRLLNKPNLKSTRVIKAIGIFIIFSVAIGLLDDMHLHRNYAVYEVSTIESVAPNIPQGSLSIAHQRWAYLAEFYSNRTISTDSGSCILLSGEEEQRVYFNSKRDLDPNRNIFIILDSSYLEFGAVFVPAMSCVNNGKMTQEQLLSYQNRTYFNRVFSSTAGSDNWVSIFALV